MPTRQELSPIDFHTLARRAHIHGKVLRDALADKRRIPAKSPKAIQRRMELAHGLEKLVDSEQAAKICRDLVEEERRESQDFDNELMRMAIQRMVALHLFGLKGKPGEFEDKTVWNALEKR